jgi:lipid A disaccharide synthetase
MKYYIIAGEASGDLHGSNLMKALYREDPQADIRFWGGDLMQAVGGTMVKHYRELAFMGFIEVVFNLKTILGNIKSCKQDIEQFKPDAIIFIDYPVSTCASPNGPNSAAYQRIIIFLLRFGPGRKTALQPSNAISTNCM